jgi:hypothetical protein
MENPQEVVDEIADTEANREAWNDVMGIESLQQFGDSEIVNTPDGLGSIDDIITEGTVDDMDATEDEPVYAVVVEDEDVGVGFYRESDLSEGDISELPGPDNPESELEDNGDEEAMVAGDGRFTWPESWRDSPQPARLIALKAWAGMGGSWRGCRREMVGNIASPERFCSDFKDRLYGTEKWRGGWAD